MRGRREERIEAAVDHIAAALFAAAVAYCSFVLAAGSFDQPSSTGLAAGSAILAYILSARLLRTIRPRAPQFEIRAFRIADLEASEPEELLLTDQVELLLTEADRLRPPHTAHAGELILTDADRLQPTSGSSSGELLLDDILSELGPSSRVVRLFDPAAMPSPGELDAQIQQHLREGNSPTAPDPIAPPDASQALHEALAKLRRSLR